MKSRLGTLLVLLVPLLLIAGPAVWKIHQLCQLSQDDCESWALLDFALTDKFALAGSVLLLIAMLTLAIVVIRSPGKSDEIQEDIPDERKIRINGTIIMLIAFVVYLGASAALLMTVSIDHITETPESVNIFVWKIMGPMYGAGFVYPLLWHVNDYLVKPASNILLAVLFFATVGAVYWMQKTMVIGF